MYYFYRYNLFTEELSLCRFPSQVIVLNIPRKFYYTSGLTSAFPARLPANVSVCMIFYESVCDFQIHLSTKK